jgi:hypothetical protein
MYKIHFCLYSTHCFRSYEVLNAVLLKIKVFFDNSPRRKVSSCRSFEDIYGLHFQGREFQRSSNHSSYGKVFHPFIYRRKSICLQLNSS